MDTMNPRGKTVRHRCVSITQGAGPFGTGTPSQRQPLAETVAMPRPGPCPRVAAALGGAAARVSGRSWVEPWAGRAAPHNARAGLASRAFPLAPPRGPRPAGRPIESKEKERWRRQAAGVALRLDGGGRSSETGVWRLRCCGSFWTGNAIRRPRATSGRWRVALRLLGVLSAGNLGAGPRAFAPAQPLRAGLLHKPLSPWARSRGASPSSEQSTAARGRGERNCRGGGRPGGRGQAGGPRGGWARKQQKGPGGGTAPTFYSIMKWKEGPLLLHKVTGRARSSRRRVRGAAREAPAPARNPLFRRLLLPGSQTAGDGFPLSHLPPRWFLTSSFLRGCSR